MQISKKIFVGNIKIKVFCENSIIKLSFFSQYGALISKLQFQSAVIYNKGSLFVFNNFKIVVYELFINYIKLSLYRIVQNKYTFYSKLHMIGLGFKNFVLGNQLYILVGDCNYIMFEIPASLKIFCKKNQIYLLGIDREELFDFSSKLKKIKHPNFYKGKGILEFKNFKFTKLKVGKKQRFM